MEIIEYVGKVLLNSAKIFFANLLKVRSTKSIDIPENLKDCLGIDIPKKFYGASITNK